MPHLVKPFRGNVGTVLPEDGLVEAELHMDVLRIVVEGVDVNQYALYDEYRAHVASSIYRLSATKVQKLFDKHVTLPTPFIYY